MKIYLILLATSKNYVDNLSNDPNIMKSSAHIDLNDEKITNARFNQVNQSPQIDSHLTAKFYVANAIDETSLVRNNQENDFKKNNLTNINSITLIKQAENVNEVITKAYVDQFHQENERSRRDLGFDFYDEPIDLVEINDKELTNLDSITVKRNPSSDNELADKKYVDDSIEEGTILRFNQTPQNYLKVSVGNDTYNLTKHKEIQLTDTTVMKAGNTGGYLLPYWKNVCNDKNNSGKIQNFIKSTKTKNPTDDSGANSIRPIEMLLCM